jgi:2-hydroxychromene-2-carboxylate isomerase
MAPPTVEFFFDYASPFSYLASESASQRLPGVELAYRPIYLRGLELFSKGIPYSAQKLQYLVQDIRRCAEDLSIPVDIPRSFPVNGLYALRGGLAAQRAGCFAAYHTPMFRAAWRDRRDISRKEVVVEIATELGLSDVAGAIDDPAIKEQLKVDTDAAARRGLFGAPTFFVGQEMFWGHDRMHQVAKAAQPAGVR